MKKEYTETEIQWRTEGTYVDIDTGEIITKEQTIKNYIIINKKTETHVYKTTGTRKIQYECTRSRQLKLW